MKNDPNIPISRALGRFVGHLWHATTKPAPPADTPKNTRTEPISSHVEEKKAQIDGQPVILRKITIEEIEIPNDPAAE